MNILYWKRSNSWQGNSCGGRPQTCCTLTDIHPLLQIKLKIKIYILFSSASLFSDINQGFIKKWVCTFNIPLTTRRLDVRQAVNKASIWYPATPMWAALRYFPPLVQLYRRRVYINSSSSFDDSSNQPAVKSDIARSVWGVWENKMTRFS